MPRLTTGWHSYKRIMSLCVVPLYFYFSFLQYYSLCIGHASALGAGISKWCVFAARVKDREIRRRETDSACQCMLSGCPWPLPLSFPSLSAHVWQTVGKRQKKKKEKKQREKRERGRANALQKSQSLLLLNHSTQCVYFTATVILLQQTDSCLLSAHLPEL